MINQMFGRRDLAALSRRVSHERRVDAIRSSVTAQQIKTALAAIVVVGLFFVLMALAQIATDRADHKTIPAEQTAGTDHWRN